MNRSDTDDLIRESYERNSPTVDVDMAWEMLETRLAGEKYQEVRESSSSAPKPAAPRALAPARRSGLRLAVYASIAVVLVAAVTIGSLEAVKHLGKDQPIVYITDDTLGPAATGQTTQVTQGPAVSSGTWQQLLPSSGVQGKPVNVLAMDPGDPAVLYAGTDQGLFKSTDAAATWTGLPVTGTVEMIAVDPASPSGVYVTADWVLYKSLDAGATWTRVSDDPSAEPDGFVQLWFDPSTSPSTIYGSKHYAYRFALGPFKSTDGGSTWISVAVRPGMWGEFNSLAIDPSSHMLYVTGLPETEDWMLMRSSDGGATWEDVSAGVPAGAGSSTLGTALSVVTDPRNASRLFLYVVQPGEPAFSPIPGSKIFASSDRAQTWSELTGPELEWAKAVYHAASETPAAAIEAAESFLAGSDRQVVVDPSDPSVLYRASTQGVEKSINGGATWDTATVGMNYEVSRVVIDPQSPNTLYAATSASIVESTNGGGSWRTILDSSGSIVVAPSLPSRLYAWTSAGFLRSDDGGATWTQVEASGLPSLAPQASASTKGGLMLVASDRPETVFASVADGLYLSTNGGGTWGKAAGIPGAPQVVVEAPDDPSTLYAGEISSGVFKSTDGGETWAPVGDRSWESGVYQLATDPFDPLIIYAVEDAEGDGSPSIWRSTDGGKTWGRIHFKGPSDLIVDISFDRLTPGTLYVSADGFYRSTDGGATWQNITGKLSGAERLILAPGGVLYAIGTSAGIRSLYKWVPGAE